MWKLNSPSEALTQLEDIGVWAFTACGKKSSLRNSVSSTDGLMGMGVCGGLGPCGNDSLLNRDASPALLIVKSISSAGAVPPLNSSRRIVRTIAAL
jgi:hypothetical protein